MFICTKGNLPQLADQDDGRVLPFIVGMPRRHTAIGLQVGLSGRLGEDLTATTPANGGTIKLATVAFLNRLPTTGKIQIDNERFTWTGKNRETTSLTGITRTVDTTAAAAHKAGVLVQQVLPTNVYGVGENPRMVHFTKGNIKVFVDGKLKAPADNPPHTVNLDDRTTLANRSIVAISFDTTQPVPKPEQLPQSGLMYDFARTGPREAPTWGTSSGGGTGSSYRPIGSDYLGATVAIPPTSSPPTPVQEYPSPLMGTVEFEIEGLQDDSSGTITGVANTLIRRPMHVVTLLLREAWNERNTATYKSSTFTATHTKQAALDFNWDLVFEGMAFGDFQSQALMMGRAELFNESTLWQYVWRERKAPSIVLTTSEVLEDSIHYQTPRTELVEDLEVKFDEGTFAQSFSLRSTRGRPRFGAPVPRTLTLPWVQAEAMARYLGIYWLSQWDLQRMQIQVKTPWTTVALELGDTIGLDEPLMVPFGKGQVIFSIRNKGLDLDTYALILEGEEQDAPAVVLSHEYRIQGKGAGVLLSHEYAIKATVFDPNVFDVTGVFA